MRSIEEFLSEVARRKNSPSAAFTSDQWNRRSALPDAMRQAASRGWHVFPVSRLAKLMGNPDLLIGEASSNLSRLEELSAEYAPCEWRLAHGPSSLCVLELSGRQGSHAFAALSGQEECLTLQAQRADMACAFFGYPEPLVLRDSAKKLAPGLRMLGPDDSCTIPPCRGWFYINPWAEVEAVPKWLRELAFDAPDTPPAITVSVPVRSSRPAPCRSRQPFAKPPRTARNGYPVHDYAGWRAGFRISRRR